MGYENSKACQLVATDCACCGRPLVDAKSVELGIGPICRKKYWDLKEIPEAHRRAANKRLYKVAALLSEKSSEALAILPELRELGFDVLVDRIEKRVIKVSVVKDEGAYIVSAPFNADAIHMWRTVGQWQKSSKTYRVPVAKRKALWSLLTSFYSGLLAKGDTYFTVPEAA
jgi:hypothetical protein